MNDTSHSTAMPLADRFPKASYDDWQDVVHKLLNGQSFGDRLVSHTADGVPILPLYTRSGAELPVGRQPVSQRSANGWDIAQLHIESDPGELSEALHDDFEGGGTHPVIQIAARAQPGLAVENIAPVLAKLPAGRRLGLQAGCSFEAAAAALPSDFQDRITINADPLGAMAACGGLDQPLDDALAALGRLMSESVTHSRPASAISDGRPYHAAGATEAQELGCLLATLIAYLKVAENAGISPGHALSTINFGLASDAQQFVSIAKLRAARRLIHCIAENVGATGHRPRISVTTSWRMLTKHDPWTNVLRTTIAAAAAAMGGADDITILPYCQPIGKPDKLARRIARNTHHVLIAEAQLGLVTDPGAGSWFIETLTDQLAREAWSFFQEIEFEGGMAAALNSGLVQDRIMEAAEHRYQDISTLRQKITGTTAYPDLTERLPDVAPWDSVDLGRPTHAEVRKLVFRRDTEPFEALRVNTLEEAVFVAALGSRRDYSERLDWVNTVLAAGGIMTVVPNEPITESRAAGLAFAQSATKVAIIVSSDEVYREIGEASIMALKLAGASHVYVAGKPQSLESDLRAAGADGFLSVGTDQITQLSALRSHLASGGMS